MKFKFRLLALIRVRSILQRMIIWSSISLFIIGVSREAKATKGRLGCLNFGLTDPFGPSTDYWRAPAVNDFSTRFSTKQRKQLVNHLQTTVRIYHSQGLEQASSFLVNESSLAKSGVKIIRLGVELTDSTHSADSSLLAKELTKFLDRIRPIYDYETKTAYVPDLYFVDPGSVRHLTPKELRNRPWLNPIQEEAFLVSLEEVIHALQSAYGRTLSKEYRRELYEEQTERVEEYDIPLLFEEWGLPVNEALLSLYSRDQFIKELRSKKRN